MEDITVEFQTKLMLTLVWYSSAAGKGKEHERVLVTFDRHVLPIVMEFVINYEKAMLSYQKGNKYW